MDGKCWTKKGKAQGQQMMMNEMDQEGLWPKVKSDMNVKSWTKGSKALGHMKLMKWYELLMHSLMYNQDEYGYDIELLILMP